VVLQGGKLWGGDEGLYYVGSYTEAGNQFSAKVSTDRHAKVPGLQSVFGKDRVNISLSGTTNGDVVNAKGTAVEAPGISFSATLTKLSD
jgi:hypothetical protein